MYSSLEIFIIILVIALSIIITRTLPHIIFSKRDLPNILKYYEKYLPFSLMAILFCFCFSTVKFSIYPYGIPEILTLIVLTILQVWKRNLMLSILLVTIFYLLILNQL